MKHTTLTALFLSIIFISCTPSEKKETNNNDDNNNKKIGEDNNIKEISRDKDNINIMISNEINTNNEENKPVKKLTNDFFKNLSKSNENGSNKVVSFNEDEEYENDRYNSRIVYTNNNIMDLLQKVLNNQESILTNQEKIMKKIFFT